MGEERGVYRVLLGKPEGRKVTGLRKKWLMSCKKQWASAESLHVFIRRIFANGGKRIFSVNKSFKAKLYLD